jgi:hypothetical protein
MGCKTGPAGLTAPKYEVHLNSIENGDVRNFACPQFGQRFT